MKLAYFSPLGPQRSGISDYSEALLPYLAAAADVTLFVDGFQPLNPELTARFEIHDYRRKRSLLKKLDDFDAVLYHMGNDHRYHSGILDAMRMRPGIVVLHDFALQDFFLGLARERNDFKFYLEEVQACYGTRRRLEVEDELERGATPSIVYRPLEFPLSAHIVNSAEGVIVHSDWARQRLQNIAPGVPIVRIPHLIKFDESEHRVETSNAEVRIANFGLITPGKGIELALRALSKLKDSHRFKYSLVGEPNGYYDVRKLIRDYRMDGLVEVTGHVSLDEFLRRMNETDIALNIRERTVGETSGCLCRLMGRGVCSVVADAGWYSELPDDSVVKLPIDSTTEELLIAYLRRLIEDQSLRTRIGANAERYVRATYAVERSATAYLNFIQEILDRRIQRQLITTVAADLTTLGTTSADQAFLESVARDVSLLTAPTNTKSISVEHSSNGNNQSLSGRTPKVPGIDYKQAAKDYLGNIPEERQHHLRTKPFYNLANKPTKYRNEGMDEDTHRHFCDFANMAVTLALPAGSRILDVGCGSGWLAEYFARLGYVVKGIDISPALIQMSRDRVAGVPYGVDHETPLSCSFAEHDIEISPLPEKFDAIICYDSLHHFEDEESVMRNLAAMLDVGGVLFILEGERPPSGSASEDELFGVMSDYGTLESPFDFGHLRRLLDLNGLAVIGDYVSVNGLFQRETIVDEALPLGDVATDYNYLACKKVSETLPASSVPDSRRPGFLRAEIELLSQNSDVVMAGEKLEFELSIRNAGDTLWIAGRETRLGTVMPGIKIFDGSGAIVSELHGQPPLPHPIAPSEMVKLKVSQVVPRRPGRYKLKFDLVDQHVSWFEDAGSKPLLIEFEVTSV
jgi:glycosyltransferase involved in cell wall biosynthesis/SAM-dependent methyltransferase